MTRLLLLALGMLAAPSGLTAQELGLLLGLATRGNHHESSDRLSTTWLPLRGDSAGTPHRLFGLVVPTRSGFRRVWLDRSCKVRSRSDPETIHCADAIRTQPASRTLPRVRAASAENACTTDRIIISFAAPEVLSLERYGWRSDCYNRGFSDEHDSMVRRHESPAALHISGLHARAGDAYLTAARVAKNHGGEVVPSQDNDVCGADTTDDTTWQIVRERDRWIAQLNQQQGSELCSLQATIPWELPPNIVGYAEPRADWDVVKRALPDVESVFMAPGGARAVIVLPKAITVYSLVKGRPMRRLYSVARADYPETDVVMVQWAIGSSVGHWSRVLNAIP
jgi:hypothetical protein